MDPFGLFSSSKIDIKTTSSKHKKRGKKRIKFESSSSDDEHTTYSSYNSRSRSQINQSDSNATNSSSSDLDMAQLDDFKPLLSSKKHHKHNKNITDNKLNESQQSQQSQQQSQQPQRLEFRSKTMGDINTNNNKLRNTVNDKFNKTSDNIVEFRDEIDSIKSMNRNYNNTFGESRSENNLMTQIHDEHKEQDEVLDDMKTVLERLTIMSQDIGNEIAEQDELIQDTTEHADYTRDKLKRVEQQITELMKKTGLTQCKIIMILICMVILLLLLILYS